MTTYIINSIPVIQHRDYIEVQYHHLFPDVYVKLTPTPTDGAHAYNFPNGFLGHNTWYYEEDDEEDMEMLLSSFVYA